MDSKRQARRSASPAQQEQPKAWMIWMLFGLGWFNFLFFGLSIIPAFNGVVKWSLWMFGWIFVAFWWAGTAMGANYGTNSQLKMARTSCLIMSCIGTTIGAVPSIASFLSRSFYIIQSVAVAALVFFALNYYTEQNKGQASTDAQAAQAAEPSPAAEEAAARVAAVATEGLKEGPAASENEQLAAEQAEVAPIAP